MRIHGAQEDGLELIHSSICEKQCWIRQWYDRRGRHLTLSVIDKKLLKVQIGTECMAIFSEIIKKCVANAFSSPFGTAFGI